MIEVNKPTRIIATAVAFAAGVSVLGYALRPEEQTLQPASPLLANSLESCKIDDTDAESFKVVDKNDQHITFEYPVKLKKNNQTLSDPNSGIGLDFVARYVDGNMQSALVSTPDQMAFDESRNVITHTFDMQRIKKEGGSFAVSVYARAEETKDGPHHGIDMDCGPVLLQEEGPTITIPVSDKAPSPTQPFVVIPPK